LEGCKENGKAGSDINKYSDRYMKAERAQAAAEAAKIGVKHVVRHRKTLNILSGKKVKVGEKKGDVGVLSRLIEILEDSASDWCHLQRIEKRMVEDLECEAGTLRRLQAHMRQDLLSGLHEVTMHRTSSPWGLTLRHYPTGSPNQPHALTPPPLSGARDDSD